MTDSTNRTETRPQTVLDAVAGPNDTEENP